MDLSEARTKAINKFNKLNRKEIICPAIWLKVKFSNEWFSHITYKDKKHRRKTSEQAIRFQCFLDVEEIITKSHLMQEYMEKEDVIKVRDHWVTKHIKKMVEYIWLIWVIEHHNTKSRTKVILKKEADKDYAEYLSVIPARNTKWDRNFIWPIY